MLKLILTGVWVTVVALGAVYGSIQFASSSKTTDPEAERRALEEYVPGELITIPAIADGEIKGYFLAKLSYSAKKDKVKDLPVPLKETATDTLYELLVGSKLIDMSKEGGFELATFKTAVKDGLNKRLNGDVIGEVLVEQLEYLTKEDLKRISNAANAKQPEPVSIVDKNGEIAKDKIPEKEGAAAAH